MRETERGTIGRGPLWTRRAWLAAAAAAAAAASASGKLFAGEPTLSADDQATIKPIEDQARKARLAGFETTSSEHYLAIGNASDLFRKRALEICEKLAKDYISHFQFKNLGVKPLGHRLAVVTLADAASFTAFSGMEASPAVGGFYDRDMNWLAILDNRSLEGANQTVAKQANLVSLVHEATHQLTFNTGLLNRDGDVPVALSEGLATYAETWQPSGRISRLGHENAGRRQGFDYARREGQAWIPLSQLLQKDDVFRDGGGGGDSDAVLQLAYAEAWLLVYQLLQPSSLARFRAYLRAIRGRKDTSSRLDDAKQALGDLDAFDRSLRRKAGWR